MPARMQRARELFDTDLNCAQSVLLCFAGRFDLDPKLLRKSPVGFGGAMGHSGKLCGALAGGIMVIGLTSSPMDDTLQRKNRAYEITAQLIADFRERYGEVYCLLLLSDELKKQSGC